MIGSVKYLAAAAGIAVLLGAVSGCGNPVSAVTAATKTPSAKNPAALALVLADVSQSTRKSRTRYPSYFANVLNGVPGGTLVVADQIDSNPLSDSTLHVRAFLESSTLLGKNPATVRHENAVAEDAAEREFKQLLSRRPFGDSILDALDIAHDVFAAYPTAKTRYLVIFSDMIETSSRYRFTQRNLEPSRIAKFISDQKAAGNLPDLSGVEVYVAGAGATRGDDAHVLAIQGARRFWASYFRAAGAELPDYRYGPELIRFP
jgi:hypothetical protein